MPTPDEARAAMANHVSIDLNNGIARGDVIGVEPVPVTPVPGQPPVGIPGAAPVPGAIDPQIDPSAVIREPGLEAPPVSPPGPVDGQDPEPLIFGKYKTMGIAETSMINTQNTLSQAYDQIASLEQRLALQNGTPPYAGQPATLPGGSPGARERVNPLAPVDWGIDEGVVSVAQNVGVEPAQLAPLAETVYAKAREGVAAEVEAQLAPQRQQQDAAAYMQANYPESLNHQVELSNFVRGNANVATNMQSMIAAGNSAGALEYSWQMYSVAQGLDTQSAMRANASVAEDERVAARAHAGLPASQNNPIHASAQKGAPPTEEQMAHLLARRKAGDQDAEILHRRMGIASQLPAEWFPGVEQR